MLILASQSASRRAMLEAAGIAHEAIPRMSMSARLKMELGDAPAPAILRSRWPEPRRSR